VITGSTLGFVLALAAIAVISSRPGVPGVPATPQAPATLSTLGTPGTTSARWTSYAGSRLAVAGGRVYAGSEDDNVYALDAATGHRRWAFTTGYEVDSTPAVANGTVYVGSG
jgi:outer membrane protein assembly factor BamB